MQLPLEWTTANQNDVSLTICTDSEYLLKAVVSLHCAMWLEVGRRSKRFTKSAYSKDTNWLK